MKTPRFEMHHLSPADFTLYCKCGTVTTYGSMFKQKLEKGMYLNCRECGREYMPFVKVHIIDIKEKEDKYCSCKYPVGVVSSPIDTVETCRDCGKIIKD